jgi:hypothetical protein
VGMSTFRNPVGPQPSTVYWRRRLLVVLGLVVVIVVIVLIIARPGSGTPTGSVHTPSAKPSETASSTGTLTTCKSSDITVEAVTDKASYQAGETPMLSMTITNNGTKACSLSAGSDVQVYVITSGSDPIWTSKDCQTNPVTQVAELAPGVPTASTPFAWDRTRSSPTTCDGTRPAVAAGGASYHLTVSVGDITSAKTKQFLLN